MGTGSTGNKNPFVRGGVSTRGTLNGNDGRGIVVENSRERNDIREEGGGGVEVEKREFRFCF